MRPGVAAHHVAMFRYRAHEIVLPGGVLADHEERRFGVVLRQSGLDLRRVARVGTVVEGERDDLLLEASGFVQSVAPDESFGDRLISIEVNLEGRFCGMFENANGKQE